eukprot:scaffold126892_cov18-Tisochrysis_lutea.AAC.1
MEGEEAHKRHLTDCHRAETNQEEHERPRGRAADLLLLQVSPHSLLLKSCARIPVLPWNLWPPQLDQYTGNNLFLASYKDTGPSADSLARFQGAHSGRSSNRPQFH